VIDANRSDIGFHLVYSIGHYWTRNKNEENEQAMELGNHCEEQHNPKMMGKLKERYATLN